MARSRSSKPSSASSSTGTGSSTNAPASSPQLSLSRRILNVLKAIDRPAEFVANGQCLSIPLGLHVDGFGDVGLPLSATEAKRLIKCCRQAPYGKGTQTVVDTKVRKVWELDTDHFKIANPKWDMLLDFVLREVEGKLGLPQKSLAAHLYKLLVYEKGSFFLPHRDGEKLDRMVATLVINLPSKHTGGELVIRHQGKQCAIAMTGAASGLETEYVAFYADCQHEVRPIQSGYRLCLTYNLALASRKSQVAARPADCDTAARQLESIFRGWQPNEHENLDRADGLDLSEGAPSSPAKLAVLLDHRYSEEGLSVDNLKGVDLAQANTLFDAAERAGCDAYLALVTLWQNGSAEGDEYSYGYSRQRYSHWDDDEEEDEDEDEETSAKSKYTMLEVFENSLTANHWSDRTGQKFTFGEIPLEDDEIVSAVEITDTDPSDEDFEGYTGNAGMTLERWYHKAAIVIWPRNHRLKILCDAGTDSAIAGFRNLFLQTKKTAPDYEARLDECRRFAQQIVATWSPTLSRSDWDPDDRKVAEQARRNRADFWKSIVKLNFPELITEAWCHVAPNDDRLEFPNEFLKWCEKQGWEASQQGILSLVETTTNETLRRNVALLRQLATLPNITRERKEICHELAPLLVEAVERLDSAKIEEWNAPQFDRKEFTGEVVQALFAVGREELVQQFLNWQSAHKRYQLVEVQIPVALQLASHAGEIVKMSPAVQDWIQGICQELQLRTRSAPRRPTDWQRPSKLSCSCSDCKELAAFLASPVRAEARFPMTKAQRQHMHQEIENSRCDCTHETLRIGRPQILVCKKTLGSFNRAIQEYERDRQHLDAIVKVIAQFKSTT